MLFTTAAAAAAAPAAAIFCVRPNLQSCSNCAGLCNMLVVRKLLGLRQELLSMEIMSPLQLFIAHASTVSGFETESHHISHDSCVLTWSPPCIAWAGMFPNDCFLKLRNHVRYGSCMMNHLTLSRTATTQRSAAAQ